MALILLSLALILVSASIVAAPLPEPAFEFKDFKTFVKLLVVQDTIRTNGSLSISPLDKYIFVRKLGSGGFGESWMARPRNPDADILVIKKIKKQVARYSNFKRSGLREKHFGELILHSSQEGREHVAGFVDSFVQSDELYLVSLYGGIALDQLIYEIGIGEGVWKPSNWWKWMRQTDNGKIMMRKIIFQLLTGVKFLHQNNITHRDIKPSNMVICFQNQQGRCSAAREDFANMNLRIIDFGSSIDDFSRSNLYGPDGPSRAEQTMVYMPPESLIDDKWIRGSSISTSKYDTWTVGQVILELIMGTPFVFSTERASTNFDPQVDWIFDRLIAMSRFCIDIPWARFHQGSTKCSDTKFSKIIKSRDPLHLGFPDVLLLQLARQLLAGNPDERLTAEAALQHPYFQDYQFSEDRGEL